LKDNKTYGENIEWTPLQYSCALGKQKVIDFLIENGADLSIKDAPGRTAQDISNYLKTGCNFNFFMKKFLEFVKSPYHFFTKLNSSEKKKYFELFNSEFENYLKSISNTLDEQLIPLIDLKKDFQNLSFLRVVNKDQFLECISSFKKTDPLDDEILSLKKKNKDLNLNDNENYKKVFNSLYQDWIENNTTFTEELDSMVKLVDFKENSKSRDALLKEFKKNPEKVKLKFPQIVETLELLEEFFRVDEFERFVESKKLEEKTIGIEKKMIGIVKNQESKMNEMEKKESFEIKFEELKKKIKEDEEKKNKELSSIRQENQDLKNEVKENKEKFQILKDEMTGNEIKFKEEIKNLKNEMKENEIKFQNLKELVLSWKQTLEKPQ
jgi:hypothetical protein